MNICDDCNINDCDSCYESDCDCNLLSHTIAPTVLVQQAIERIVDPDLSIDAIAGKDGGFELQLRMNRREYRIVIEPA